MQTYSAILVSRYFSRVGDLSTGTPSSESHRKFVQAEYVQVKSGVYLRCRVVRLFGRGQVGVILVSLKSYVRRYVYP